MPWLPELFTAPALARIWEDERRRRPALVPFFAGAMTGETQALVDSFAGEPELHPVHRTPAAAPTSPSVRLGRLHQIPQTRAIRRPHRMAPHGCHAQPAPTPPARP